MVTMKEAISLAYDTFPDYTVEAILQDNVIRSEFLDTVRGIIMQPWDSDILNQLLNMRKKNQLKSKKKVKNNLTISNPVIELSGLQGNQIVV